MLGIRLRLSMVSNAFASTAAAYLIMMCFTSGEAQAQKKYQINVLTEPEGAAVHVGSRDTPKSCDTPCVVQLPEGEHEVVIIKDGFKELVEKVKVDPKNLPEIWVELEEAHYGYVAVLATPKTKLIKDAKVLVDGKEVGPLPQTLKLEIGTHQIEVAAKGYQRFESWIELKIRDRLEISVDLRKPGEAAAKPVVIKKTKMPYVAKDSLVDVTVGFELGWRSYRYENATTPTARIFDTSGVPLVRASVAYYPFGRAKNPLLKGLGAIGEMALGKPKDVDNVAEPIETAWTEFEGGLRWLYGVGSSAKVGAEATFGRMRFGFAGSSLDDEVPEVTYIQYRLALKTAFRVDRYSADISVGYLGVTSFGDLEDRFLDASARGLYTRAGVSMDLMKGLSARGGFLLRRYTHDFANDPMDVIQADGGTDLFYGFMVGVGYSY